MILLRHDDTAGVAIKTIILKHLRRTFLVVDLSRSVICQRFRGGYYRDDPYRVDGDGWLFVVQGTPPPGYLLVTGNRHIFPSYTNTFIAFPACVIGDRKAKVVKAKADLLTITDIVFRVFGKER